MADDVCAANVCSEKSICPQETKRSSPTSLAKSRSTGYPTTGERISATERELDMFLRVGQLVHNSSACVNRSTLDPEQSMVYELWQHCRTSAKGTQFFQCRRARRCRNKRGFVGSACRQREKRAAGYVGCNCVCKMTVYLGVKEGSFRVTFRGTHNHDVQADMLNFLNPILVCRTIREMVDAKLFAGVTKGFRIKHEITNELLQERNEHKTYFQLRNFNMVIALTAQHIRNRMKQLCMDPDMLAHMNDATAVVELLATWARELGKDSPMRYFKQVGAKNDDTDDTNPKSDFKPDDFLLVM